MTMPAAVSVGLWINVGSGPLRSDGWISLDGSWQAMLGDSPRLAALASWLTGRPTGDWPAGIVRHDLRKPLPFADGSAAVVYSSHTLEHLHRDDAVQVLRDAHRILQPGGVCRAIVPDLAALVQWYHERAASDPDGASEQLMSMMLMRSRSSPRSGTPLGLYRQLTNFDAHKWMYDAAGLQRLFRDAGFAEPRVRGYLDSAIEHGRLAQVERADRLEDGAGVCVEAIR